MSKVKNPMELVDRYLQAVRFWLPRTRKQDDLIAELGEDLRSQIEDKESELGRAADEEEVAAILKRCGAPMLVAGRLGPQLYLIGPTLFPIYSFVLKMVLFWILVPVFIFIIGPVNVANSGGNWGGAIANTIGALWSGLFIAAGTITLVFVILERSNATSSTADKWDPRKLPPVQTTGRKPPSRLHTVSQLFFAIFGFVWLLLIPGHPFMILGPGAAILQPAPILHRFLVPVLLLAVFAIVRPAMILAKPQWTWFPPVGELVATAFTLIVLNFILKAGFPYLVLTDAAANSAQYIKVAAIVNVSILISLAGAWLGLCIAMVVQLWQVLSFFRERWTQRHEPASLQAS